MYSSGKHRQRAAVRCAVLSRSSPRKQCHILDIHSAAVDMANTRLHTYLLAALGQRLENGRHGREPFKKYTFIPFSDSFELPHPVDQSSFMELREVLDLHLKWQMVANSEKGNQYSARRK